MLTRRQLALAPIIKTAEERGRESFGREVADALDRVLRTVSFDECETQEAARNLLYRRVRKALRGKGAPFSRYGYIAKRMCKTMVSEIVKAGLTKTTKEDFDNVDTEG